jgi:hypothetical protein
MATVLMRSASASTFNMYMTAISRNINISPVIRSLSGIQCSSSCRSGSMGAQGLNGTLGDPRRLQHAL